MQPCAENVSDLSRSVAPENAFFKSAVTETLRQHGPAWSGQAAQERPARAGGGVKGASPEIATAGAEMGSEVTEGDAAAVVSSGRDHRRLGCSCVDRGNDDQLMTASKGKHAGSRLLPQVRRYLF